MSPHCIAIHPQHIMSGKPFLNLILNLFRSEPEMFQGCVPALRALLRHWSLIMTIVAKGSSNLFMIVQRYIAPFAFQHKSAFFASNKRRKTTPVEKQDYL